MARIGYDTVHVPSAPYPIWPGGCVKSCRPKAARRLPTPTRTFECQLCKLGIGHSVLVRWMSRPPHPSRSIFGGVKQMDQRGLQLWPAKGF